MKDLNTCEVICLDTLEATLTINGNKMVGNGTDVDCEDGEVYNMTISLEFSYNPEVSFLDKDNPSRQVIGASGDGSSAVVIQISGLAKYVNLSDIQIDVDEGDGSIDNDATILNGVYTVTYHAPEYFVREGHLEDILQGKRDIGLIIKVNGQELPHPPFSLTKPPVVLLHGLWSDASAWDTLKSRLEMENGYNEKYVVALSYDSSLAFNKLYSVIDNSINAALYLVHNDNIVAKKADIVAHSMGGVITKLYGNSSNINSITTIGTPHFGSPLADILWSLVDDASANPCESINTCDSLVACIFEIFKHPATNGAIKDLRTNLYIEANRINVPICVISGISTLTNQTDCLFAEGLLAMFNFIKEKPCSAEFSDLLKELPSSADLSDLHQFLFNQERSDWVVSESSQEGGSQGYDDDVISHLTETTDEEILQKIINFLHRTGPTASLVQPAPIKSQKIPTLQYTLPALKMAISSGDVQITNPSEGQVLQIGDTVNVKVNISSQNAIVIIAASTGESALIDHAPYNFQFIIPDKMIGPLTIIAGAIDDKGFIGSDEVTINVFCIGNLTDIKVYPEISPLYLPPGASIPLSIYGSYDDNVTRDVTSSGCGTTYISSSPDVAEVTSEGLITVKSLGQTTITVANSGVSREMTVIGESTILQGTVGTRFTLQGSGFGSKKPTVYVEYEKTPGIIKKVSSKVENYSDTSITCLWTSTLPPGTYNLKVQPKIKGANPISMGTFSVKSPLIGEVTPNTGKVGDKITINGMFFSSKKPKVYLEDPSTLKRKSCKVSSSMMDPQTGTSSLQFVVPKLGSGDYNIILKNVIGEAAKTFTIP